MPPVQKRVASKNSYNKQNLKRVPFKSTWRAPCGSVDNLVISFSDDDTESEPDDHDIHSEIGDKREYNRNIDVEEIKSQRPSATSSMGACIPPKASNFKIPKKNQIHPNYTSAPSKMLHEKLSLTACKNELQSQKHDSATNILTENNQVDIKDVLTDNKKVFLHQTGPVQKTDLNFQKYLNQRKRKNSPVNGRTYRSSDLETHVESKIDGKNSKRLKLNKSAQSKNTSDGCIKTGLLDQINLRKNLCPDDTNKTFSTSSEVLCEELTSYSNAVAITTLNGFPSMQENNCTSIACISSNDDILTHKAIIGSTTEYHKKESNAEDVASCNKNPFSPNLVFAILLNP